MSQHAEEVARGQRFKFGKNWAAFLSTLDDQRIAEAGRSLASMLDSETLKGQSFLDIGCGSGLFSLAARRLGARVCSFDYDPDSVACTRKLKERYFPQDQSWAIEEGSALDEEHVRSLGLFDIVYSWGVLHATGDMWKALEIARLPVKEKGLLFISIYNDRGIRSRFWRKVKRTYCSGLPGKVLVIGLFFPYLFLIGLAFDVVSLTNPVRRYTEYRRRRGMSVLHDWVDWLGGYPYEVARPEEIFDFYKQRGFLLRTLKTTNNIGTNQFVFQNLGERPG